MTTATLTNDYHSSITAAVSAKAAFDSISNVPAWWATDFEGSAKNPGDQFTVRFGETWVRFEIGETVPEKKTEWQVVDCYLPWLNDKKEWNGTKIVWELSSQNGSTRIDMTHVGLVPEVECYENCKAGWNKYVTQSLLKLLTEHAGTPEGKKS